MPTDSPRPAAVTLGVPTFTLVELHKQLDAVLGKGASGTVYSLRDFPGLAAKEILLDGLDQRSIDAAKLELATLPALSHPGILRYHQVIEDESFIYIVMDRHDGTLECLLIEHKRKKTHVSNRLICSIARQVAAALAYLSSASGVDAKGKPLKGLVHRDLKPANILVAADGEQFILADFGLCKDALRSGSTVAGTKPYMAPETLIYNSTSPASDIWSLGVIIYELAALKRPNFLEGREPKDVFIDGWKPDLSDVKNDFIRAILERIFVLDPEKRLTARELHEMLSPCDVSADELGAQYMVLQHKCSSLETALNDASARIAILEGDTKTKSEKIVALEEGLEAKTDEIGALKEALAIKASELDSLRSIVVTQEANVNSLKQYLETKSNKVGALEQTLILKSTKIDTIDGELQNNSSKINSLESVIAVQAAEMDALKKELETRSDQINVQSSEINALKSQCKEHLATTRALKDKIALLTASNPQSGILLLPRLMRAAHTNSIETVRMLVEGGDWVSKRDEQGRTALMHAAQQGHVEPVRLLVEKEKGLQDRSGWTALMHAADGNHLEVVEILAAHECGKTDNSRRTALMIAAERGYAEIVAALAPHEKGLTDSSGNTALMFAANNAHIEAVRVLVEHEKGMSDNQNHNALYHALKNGHMEVVGVLIETDDPTDENGVTALMRAAARGDVEMVRLLAPIQKGMKDKDGNTAFMHALKNNHANTATVLREHEAPSWTSLMCAAFTGDIETAKSHLSDKDKKNDNGDTALMIAARAGRENIVEFLDPTDKNGVTALMRAAERGDVEVVRALIPLQRGRRTEYLYGSKTALMRAATCGHIEVVKLLVEYEGGLKDEDGWTALMYAAHNNYTKCIVSLLEKEAGMQDKDSQTALMFAAARGHVECVKLLLEREARLTDIHGRAALAHAARAGHREAAEILMEREKDVTGWTMLMCAAALGDVDMVSQHIDERGQKDKDDRTALILAAQNGREEVVKLLMKHEGGASGWTSLIYAAYLGDVDAVRDNLHERGRKDDVGRTALMWAAQQEHEKIVKILLEHEKGMKDIIGRTALMLATEGENKELIEMLIPCESGLQDNSGRTAFMHATVHCHTHTVELLLKHEMKIQDNEGRTALMWAIQRNRNELIKILLEHEKGIKDKQGHNALYYVLKSGRLKDICFLIETDDPTDENGVTALMRAAERGDAEMVELLAPLQIGLKDGDGCTAFIHALKNKHEGIATVLRKHEAPSWTPLMCAAVAGDIETAKRHLSDKDKKNDGGDTALMIAARAGHDDIVELLDPTDQYGITALMRAAARGDINTIAALIPLQKRRQTTSGGKCNNYGIYEYYGSDFARNFTALMFAALFNQVDAVRELAKYEAGMKAVEYRSYYGDSNTTALSIANNYNHKDIIAILSAYPEEHV